MQQHATFSSSRRVRRETKRPRADSRSPGTPHENSRSEPMTRSTFLLRTALAEWKRSHRFRMADTQAHAPLTGSGVNGANWISVDRAGLLHVLSPGRIYTFAPEASGDARPASVLNVDFFLSNCCARMTAGADGRLYVYLTAFHWSA